MTLGECKRVLSIDGVNDVENIIAFVESLRSLGVSISSITARVQDTPTTLKSVFVRIDFTGEIDIMIIK